MKKSIQLLKVIVLLLINPFVLNSCTNENEEMSNLLQSNSSAAFERSLPPPTPGELRGLYDAKFNNGVEFNLLFEYGNYVSYGNPTINDMSTQTGTRVSYVAVGVNTYQFSCTVSGTIYNFRFTYDGFSAKFNGTYGTGGSYVNEGTFNAKKPITGDSGFSFLKGYWLGNYSGMYDYLMIFEEGGKITAGAGGPFYYNCVAGVGFYEMYGDTIIGYYIYPNGYQYSFKGICNFSNKTIDGTWGHGTSSTDGSTFHLSAMNFY